MSARTSTTSRYGHSAARWPFVGAIESSIARLITIGIASESTVVPSAHTSPTLTSRHCSRHRRARPLTVGQRLRSGGSTDRKRLVTLPRYQRCLRSLRSMCQPARASARRRPPHALHGPPAYREQEESGYEQEQQQWV